MKYIKKTQLGFSLIEMSLVVSLLSVVIAYMLTTRNEEVKLQARQSKADKTIEEINTIGKAAGEYFLNHKQTWPAQFLTSTGSTPSFGADGERFQFGGSDLDMFCYDHFPSNPNFYNTDAIGELIKPVDKEYRILPTIPTASEPSYISGIDRTSPYGSTYTTYCDDTNFYISTWVNDRSVSSPASVNTVNELQAQYIAHQGPAQSMTCEDLAADTTLALHDLTKRHLCGGGTRSWAAHQARYLDQFKQMVVTVFNRPEGWFSLSQFLRKSGDSMGGDIRLLKAGETLDGITGAAAGAGILYDHDNNPLTAEVPHPGGSDIILHNGERLQEKLLNRSVILLKTTYIATTTPRTLRHDKKLIDKPICTGSAIPTLDVIPISPVVYQDTEVKILESEPALHVSPKQTSIAPVAPAVIGKWELESHFTNSLGDERPGSSVYLIFTSCSN